MKAFISYSTSLDQILALRLQTMAAVYGITSYVPPATTRQMDSPLTAEAQQQLQGADVVLAIITHTPAASAVGEMNFAKSAGKLLIPILGPGVDYSQFQPFFLVNPSDPSQTERQIVKFLAEKQRAEKLNNSLVALATLSVALLLLGAISSEA